MKWRSLFSHRVRGQALGELQGSVLVGALVIAGLIFLFTRIAAAHFTMNRYEQGESTTIVLLKEIQRDAVASQAVYLPATDVANVSNADGHEMAVYQIDGKAPHTGHFYAYCFKASAGLCQGSQTLGTLQRYIYRWHDLPQNGGSGATKQSSEVTGITAFKFAVLTTAAQYSDATLDPYAATYFQRHPANLSGAKTYHWGYPGVVSSTNDLYTVQVTLANGDVRPFAFSKHHIIFAQQLITGTATPTPNPIRVNGGAALSLTFRNPIDAPQNGTITESNYGTRSTTPAQVYTLSGCGGIATYNPSSPVTPANDGTGTAVITVVPMKQLAPSGFNCTITATDNAAQNIPIAANIGLTYAPVSSGGGVVLAGANASIDVAERNYAPDPSGGFAVQNVTGPCTPTAGASSMSNDGLYTETTHYVVTFSKGGVLCTITFVDTYGQTTQITTQQHVALQIQTWPIAVAYGAGNKDVAFAGKRSADWNVASVLNMMLGGGVAEAAGCHALAYKDAAMTLLDRNDTTFQQSLGISTDSNGCYGGRVVAYEPSGSSATFGINFGRSSCDPLVTYNGWNPGYANLIQAALTITTGTSPTAGCSIVLTDGGPAPATSGSGLVNVEIFSCKGPFLYQAGVPYCNWHTVFISGFGGTVQGSSGSDAYFVSRATDPSPVIDCSVPPDGQGGGGCQYVYNGAIEYCYDAQQGQPLLTVTPAQGNTTTFGCGNTGGNPPDFPVIQCVNPPGQPKYCQGPPTPPPGPPGGGG